jgi:hypothetical protein
MDWISVGRKASEGLERQRVGDEAGQDLEWQRVGGQATSSKRCSHFVVDYLFRSRD